MELIRWGIGRSCRDEGSILDRTFFDLQSQDNRLTTGFLPDPIKVLVLYESIPNKPDS